MSGPGKPSFADREDLGVNRIALGVTNAPRLLDTNLHDAESKRHVERRRSIRHPLARRRRDRTTAGRIPCLLSPARHGTGENERTGRWTGFNKVECGIHTFLPKKVDFQI